MARTSDIAGLVGGVGCASMISRSISAKTVEDQDSVNTASLGNTARSVEDLVFANMAS